MKVDVPSPMDLEEPLPGCGVEGTERPAPPTRPIPLHRPTYTDASSRYVTECLSSGRLRGDGPFTAGCHAWLESRLGGRAFLTGSGTSALEMAALVLGLEPGDEVICPSFTFPSTANAFLSRGVRPVFAEIRDDTLNLDERRLPEILTPRTKAIAVVHYGGVACEMDAVVELAARAGVSVIEDAAHGFGSKYRGRFLGTMGDVGCYSFHETKGVSCGEGGALVLRREALVRRAEMVWDTGTDRRAYFRGEVAQYTWRERGSSTMPSELVAACLLGQLTDLEPALGRRSALWREYRRQLKPLEDERLLKLPSVPPHCELAPDLFYVLLPRPDSREDLRAYLNARGVASAFHYLPLHLSEMGRRLGYRPGDFPATENASARLLRLPFFSGMSDEELETVVAHVYRFFRTETPKEVAHTSTQRPPGEGKTHRAESRRV